MATLYNQIDSNRRKTWILMFFFSLFIAGLGYLFSLAQGYSGPGALGYVGFFLIISGFVNLGSYYFSDSLVMAISQAHQIQEKDNPTLYHLVENLCIGSGLPMPKIYLINDPSPNAFATGRDPKHSAIAFTTGILEILEKRELEGVVAHELSHVKDYDTRLMTIVVILVGMVSLLADFFMRSTLWGRSDDDDRRSNGLIMIIALVAAIIAPISAQLIQLAISRKREFLADASGAYLTRYPEGLASALEKISQDPKTLKTATTATAHLFIVNPFKGRALSGVTKLFMTHPPVEERIQALRAM